jgi:hypothetical protein
MYGVKTLYIARNRIGKLMQTKEVVVLLGMRRLSSHCGWIIYTIQAVKA